MRDGIGEGGGGRRRGEKMNPDQYDADPLDSVMKKIKIPFYWS